MHMDTVCEKKIFNLCNIYYTVIVFFESNKKALFYREKRHHSPNIGVTIGIFSSTYSRSAFSNKSYTGFI